MTANLINTYMNAKSIIQLTLQKIRIGDFVAKYTAKFGIESCEKCKRRQKLLNGEWD